MQDGRRAHVASGSGLFSAARHSKYKTISAHLGAGERDAFLGGKSSRAGGGAFATFQAVPLPVAIISIICRQSPESFKVGIRF